MKRLALGLVAAAALAPLVPASAAGVEPILCGITPRYPCGICYVDDQGTRTCVSPRDLV